MPPGNTWIMPVASTTPPPKHLPTVKMKLPGRMHLTRRLSSGSSTPAKREERVLRFAYSRINGDALQSRCRTMCPAASVENVRHHTPSVQQIQKKLLIL